MGFLLRMQGKNMLVWEFLQKADSSLGFQVSDYSEMGSQEQPTAAHHVM